MLKRLFHYQRPLDFPPGGADTREEERLGMLSSICAPKKRGKIYKFFMITIFIHKHLATVLCV